MKKLKEITKLYIMPTILCIGVILALQTPGEPISLLNVLLGIIIGFSGGVTALKYKSKS